MGVKIFDASKVNFQLDLKLKRICVRYSYRNDFIPFLSLGRVWSIEILKNNNLKSMDHPKCQHRCTNSWYKMNTYMFTRYLSVVLSYALSFNRFQNVLGWSQFFVPDQKFIYILWQSQTFWFTFSKFGFEGITLCNYILNK